MSPIKPIKPIKPVKPILPDKSYPIYCSPINYQYAHPYSDLDETQVFYGLVKHKIKTPAGIHVNIALNLPPKIKINRVVFSYKVSNSRSYISRVILVERNKLEYNTFYNDSTPLINTSGTENELFVDNVEPAGPISLLLSMDFTNEVDIIEIGAITVYVKDVE